MTITLYLGVIDLFHLSGAKTASQKQRVGDGRRVSLAKRREVEG